MSLSATALVTLKQAKAYLKVNAATDLHVAAEYIGMGDGSDTTFSLDNTPVSGSLQLYVNNVLQTEVTHYTISDADITFVTAPTLNHPITADYDKTASANTFEVYEDEELEALIDAATRIAENYCDRAFIQRTVTEYHQGDGETTLRLFKRPISSITSVVQEVSEALSDGDGSTTAFTLSLEPTSGSVVLYVNTVLQVLTTDYTVSGTVVTFVSAPSDGAKITLTYTHTILAISEFTTQLAKGKIYGASSWVVETIYTIVYVAGEAATRALTQTAVPEAMEAVLLILADLYENRGDTIDSESITGIGSTSYKLPSRAKAILFQLMPLGGFS